MRKMKDSGIEWIGKIPIDWNVSKVKNSFDVVLGKMLQSNQKKETDELVSYMCAANITWSGVDLSTEKQMWFSESEKSMYLLKHGDLLVTEGGDVAVSCIWNDELPLCCIQNAVHRVRPKNDASNRFLYYWLYMLKSQGYIDLVCNKATLAHFTKEKLDGCFLALPSSYEQERIVSFLDAKCAEIDALIAAKEKTNALLKERRQSIIYEAVTKGLDPSVPMKDSGVEWIGEIPEGWSVRRLKTLASFQTGSTPSTSNPEYFEGDINWFTPGDFGDSLYLTKSERTLSQAAIDNGVISLFEEDSIFLVAIGATVGKIGLLKMPAYSNQQITAISLYEKKRAEYYAYWLQAAAPSIKATANYTTLPIINNAHLGETLCPFVDDVLTQSEIASYLREQCAQIDSLITKNSDGIRKLKEYRQSLIYEAVTGKIEV